MIIGLTGGIASGKSFCTDYLASQYAIRIVDADLLAREVVQVGSEGLEKIKIAFGDSVINLDGSLNRPQMRKMMLENLKVRQKLNAIVHPRVRHLMLERLSEQSCKKHYQIMSVPLLFENNLHRYADVVVVIDVEKRIQIERLMLRDGASHQSIMDMLDAQTSRSHRLSQAHFVIDNSREKKYTLNQLDYLHQMILNL